MSKGNAQFIFWSVFFFLLIVAKFTQPIEKAISIIIFLGLENANDFLARLCILHGGLICITFCPSVCLSLDNNSVSQKVL